MGITGGTVWKETLRKLFPGCWHTATDAKRKGFSVVVEDLMLRLFLHANRSERRDDLVVLWKSHPKWVFDRFPHATRYMGIFDGKAPRAKDPERRERANNRLCLTQGHLDDLGQAAYLCNPESNNMEIFRRVFGDEAKVREGKVTPFGYFLELYKNTRSMREDAIQFAEHNLVQMIPRDREVFLDGGLENGLWKRFAASCPCQVKKVDLVGEGDLKLVRALEWFPDQDMWVTSTDSDSIAILLLAMRRELQRHPRLGRRIFLDMGNMTPSKKSNVLDVVALWRAIIKRAGPGGAWNGLRNPVETFCAALISSGTDFFKGAPGVGPKTIWKTFESRAGQRIMSLSVHVDPRGTLHVAENRLRAFGRLAYAFVIHSDIQDHKDKAPTHAELEELYNPPRRERYKRNLEKYHKDAAAVKAGTFKRKRPPKPPRKPWLALTDSEMRVRVRMIGWTLAYWVDAHTRQEDNTLESLQGISRYGWTTNGKNVVEIASIVTSS